MKYTIAAIAIALLLLVGTVGAVTAQSNYQQFWSNVQMMYDLLIEDDLTVVDDVTVGGDLSLAGSLNSDITQAINTYENLGMLPTVITSTIAFTTANIATVPADEVWIVHDVLVEVTSNFNCTGDDCTLQIGDAGDANGLVDLVDAEVQAAAVDVTGGSAGWMGYMSDTKGAYLADSDFVYAPSASTPITATVGGTDPAAGAANIYIIYTRVQ